MITGQKILKVKLKNSKSNEYLTQDKGGTDSGAKNVSVWPLHNHLEDPDGRFWYLIPLSPLKTNRHYYIANAKSGQGLLQEFGGKEKNRHNAMVWPLSERKGPTDHGFIWETDTPIQANTTTRFTHFVSRQILVQEFSGTRRDERNVDVWFKDGPFSDEDGTKWGVEVEEEFPLPHVPIVPQITRDEIKKRAKSKMQGENYPDLIHVGITEVEMISGIFAEDSSPISHRLKQYYRLEKHSEWYRVEDLTNYGKDASTVTVTYTKGWSRAEEKSLSTTLGMETSVGEEGVASVKMSFSITAGYSRTDSKSGSSSATVQVNVPAGDKAALYIPRDTLVLLAPNGEEVKRWKLNTREHSKFVII